MADKTILLLMIAFVLSGILAYDRYKMDHGERGPVAELLDFAGLAQYDEAPQQRTTVIQDVYEYNPRAVLRQMRELHQKYEEERKKLVDNRKEVIERIIELNDEVASTAAIYTDELTQESARFLEKFSQVETLIGRIHQIPSQDKTLHSQNIQDIHGQIVNVFKQFIADPAKNSRELKVILDNIEKYTSADDRGEKLDCGGLSVCLAKETDYLNKEFNELQKQFADTPANHLKELRDLVDRLKIEYNFLLSNSQATEKRLGEVREDMDKKLRVFVEELVDVTEIDLKNVMDEYRKFRDAQMKLLDNLDQHRQRVVEIQMQSNNRAIEMLKSLKQHPRIRFEELINVFKSNAAAIEDELVKFDSKENNVRRILEAMSADKETLVDDIADIQLIEAERLTPGRISIMRQEKEIELEKQERRKHLGLSGGKEEASSSDNNAATSTRPPLKGIQTDLLKQKDIERSRKAQMQNMRDLNRDHNRSLDSLGVPSP